MLRSRHDPPSDVFPPDPWALEVSRYDARLASKFVGQAETMFALSNGYLGIRGTPEEGRPAQEPAVLLNGFFEHRPISYGESAYGFPSVGQSIMNCPDGTVMRLFVDQEPFFAHKAEILDYRRRLDFRTGTLTRDVHWLTSSGKRLRLRTVRLVSFADRHLAAIQYELTADDPVEIAVSSELNSAESLGTGAGDPRLAEDFVNQVLHPIESSCDRTSAILTFRTELSRQTLGCGMDHAWASDCAFEVETVSSGERAATTFTGSLAAGGRLTIQKYLAYAYGGEGDPDDAGWRAAQTLGRARSHGFDSILERQQARAAAFWDRADVEIETEDVRTIQVVRWNLFQLLQASERAEGHGISARGLTGRSYEGHYFWDTEIYVLPFLVYTNPRVARSLLKFRYDMLDKARLRARELGHRGATFPWRTINGNEASAYYAAGTAQYHINADIAYAIRKYVEVSGDDDFLYRYGAEILVETARLWRDLGFFSDRKSGRFCINGVTGPDEYTALVNNNYFTNLMARENLLYAAETVRRLASERPGAYADLAARTELADAEVEEWCDAAARMYLPSDETGIHPQDDDFFELEPWDPDATPEEHYPLLLHYHPLNLYRSQVIKQADVVLAMFLLGEYFAPEEKRRNFDYYDPLTTHDSSLSVCIQSIIANEIGYRRQALRYFDFAATMDLSDVGGNVMHGAHIASIGGTWLALVYGFAGMRDRGGWLSFQPSLPDRWSRLDFRLQVRGCRLRVRIEARQTSYHLAEGDELSFKHAGSDVLLTTSEPRAKRPNLPVADAKT